jgi:hypothetical protein
MRNVEGASKGVTVAEYFLATHAILAMGWACGAETMA